MGEVTARQGPTTPGQPVNETGMKSRHARKTVAGWSFFEHLKSPVEQQTPNSPSQVGDEGATKETEGGTPLEPRRRATYGLDENPPATRRAARKSVASVAVDSTARGGRTRVSKKKETAQTKRRNSSDLYKLAKETERNNDEDSTQGNKRTEIAQLLAKPAAPAAKRRASLKDSENDVEEIRRRAAAHKEEPDVKYAWPASQPPPKLFAPPRVMRALGEAGISARQKHKVDESFNADVPYTHRFERKINKTDGSTLQGDHKPEKDVDERLAALPQTPKKSTPPESHPNAPGPLDDLDSLFRNEDRRSPTSSRARRELSPSHRPQKRWRQDSLSQNVEKAKKDPYEGLK